MYQVKGIIKPFLALIDSLGYAGFWWLKLRRLGKPKKILCIRPDHIGDVIMTTPALRALRKRFPDSEIHVLVRGFARDVLQGNPNVDKIIAFDVPWLTGGKKESWKNTRKFIDQLKKENYDLAIDFHADPRNIWLASKVSRYRIGYGIRGYGFLLNKVVSWKPGIRHQVQRNLDLVRAIGADASAETELFINPSAEKKAKKLLKNKKNIVCISPTAARRQKFWFNDRWAAVADFLVEKKASVVLVGGKNDHKEAEEILNWMKNKQKVLNLVGKTSIQELFAVIKQSKLVISTDTAAAHIARAVRTPSLALFGPEDPMRWGYDEGKFRHVWKKRMSDITVQDVLNAARVLYAG